MFFQLLMFLGYQQAFSFKDQTCYSHRSTSDSLAWQLDDLRRTERFTPPACLLLRDKLYCLTQVNFKWWMVFLGCPCVKSLGKTQLSKKLKPSLGLADEGFTNQFSAFGTATDQPWSTGVTEGKTCLTPRVLLRDRRLFFPAGSYRGSYFSMTGLLIPLPPCLPSSSRFMISILGCSWLPPPPPCLPSLSLFMISILGCSWLPLPLCLPNLSPFMISLPEEPMVCEHLRIRNKKLLLYAYSNNALCFFGHAIWGLCLCRCNFFKTSFRCFGPQLGSPGEDPRFLREPWQLLLEDSEPRLEDLKELWAVDGANGANAPKGLPWGLAQGRGRLVCFLHLWFEDWKRVQSLLFLVC